VKTAEVSFAFPVLGFSADQDLWGFPDFRSLTTCGPQTLRERMQDGMELIDANGRRWGVRSVQRIGRTGSIFVALLSGKPQSKIEHELNDLGLWTLEEVQSRVCASMEAHPEFWCEDSERSTVFPQRLGEVRATQNIAQIHNVLGLDTFEAY
jgi:hypothetical protein